MSLHTSMTSRWDYRKLIFTVIFNLLLVYYINKDLRFLNLLNYAISSFATEQLCLTCGIFIQVVVAYEERKKDIARHKTDIQEGKSAKRRRLLEEVDGTNEEDSKHDDNFDTDLIEIPRLHKSSSLIQIHTGNWTVFIAL